MVTLLEPAVECFPANGNKSSPADCSIRSLFRRDKEVEILRYDWANNPDNA